jgi:hypothetical protein
MMSALLLLIGASCSSDALPTAPSNQESQPAVSPLLGLPIEGVLDGLGKGGGPLGQLLTCGPQRYASESKVIGPNGGTLRIGEHTFVVPRGALNKNVLITGEAPEGNVVSVRFAPEGLQFDSRQQPTLTLDYSNCGLIRNLLPKHIAYTTEKLSILSILSSVDDLLHQKVSARIKHFSRYAVAF